MERGTVIIPSELRRKYRLDDGSLLVAEEKADGILLRPVVAVLVKIYRSVPGVCSGYPWPCKKKAHFQISLYPHSFLPIR
jgi:hypothetical protein